MGNHPRYWLAAGESAEVRNVPGLIVIVDFIKTAIKKENNEDKTYTIGVQCHWVDKNWTYQKGVFHTNELIKPLILPNIKYVNNGEVVGSQ